MPIEGIYPCSILSMNVHLNLYQMSFLSLGGELWRPAVCVSFHIGLRLVFMFYNRLSVVSLTKVTMSKLSVLERHIAPL
jgi:hypothetical protein